MFLTYRTDPSYPSINHFSVNSSSKSITRSTAIYLFHHHNGVYSISTNLTTVHFNDVLQNYENKENDRSILSWTRCFFDSSRRFLSFLESHIPSFQPPFFPNFPRSTPPRLQRQSLLCPILLARNPVPGPGYYSSINENVK